MNQLIEGVKIISNYNGNISLKDRLLISSGTEQASVKTDRASTRYCKDAIVPQLPWRILTLMEETIIPLRIEEMKTFWTLASSPGTASTKNTLSASAASRKTPGDTRARSSRFSI